LTTNSRHRFRAPSESCLAANATLAETTVTQYAQLANPTLRPSVTLANGTAVDRNPLAACIKHHNTRVCEIMSDEALESAGLPGYTCTLQADILAIELIEPRIVVMSVHASCTTYELHVASRAKQSERADVHLEVIWCVTLEFELLAL
jgi:hypothetical protein